MDSANSCVCVFALFFFSIVCYWEGRKAQTFPWRATFWLPFRGSANTLYYWRYRTAALILWHNEIITHNHFDTPQPAQATLQLTCSIWPVEVVNWLLSEPSKGYNACRLKWQKQKITTKYQLISASILTIILPAVMQQNLLPTGISRHPISPTYWYFQLWGVEVVCLCRRRCWNTYLLLIEFHEGQILLYVPVRSNLSNWKFHRLQFKTPTSSLPPVPTGTAEADP